MDKETRKNQKNIYPKQSRIQLQYTLEEEEEEQQQEQRKSKLI